MTTRTKGNDRAPDANLITSRMFAQVFQAYLECSDEVQAALREMVGIVNAADATEDEREAALATIAEALFPSRHNGSLGIDLEELDKEASKPTAAFLKQLDEQEATFAERVTALLDERGITQSELANAIGVGQPAISMMLSRSCRPQRRTVERIAKELKVAPEDIWPGFKDD